MFGLDFIRKLKPCKWRYTGHLDDGVEHFGFIAQEVEALAPHDQFGFVKLDPDHIYGLVLTEFIGPIVKAVQELDERITQLEQSKKGLYAPRNMGDNQAGNNDPLGPGYDLAQNLGDVRNT